ncbi:hypothetical protein BSK59_21430 [Paenibacillus odorifer]|uniref:RES family NAD+ phosphorylase n=1 Tax=Paenibacillus odorifer TaxID=189426 RepID=UPI00096DDDA7|nr:hypothetical protein BSK59_21430 [Paenibacillus odorifer]
MKRELKVVDLRKRSISPFLFKSPYDFLEVVFLLSNFSDDLSTPVSPHFSNIEYLPTQYITELIKSKGFDGIVYSSAMASGDNIVLFDDNNVVVDSIEYVEISGINYEHKVHWVGEESDF